MKKNAPIAILRSRAFAAALSSLGILLTGPFSQAASDVWVGTTDSTWITNANWSTSPVTVPGTGDTATFNGAGNGNTIIDLGTGVTLGALLFDTSSAAAYTIGSGGAGIQTLTLGTVGNAITMNSTVANDELINANLALATTSTAGTPGTYYTVANNSTTNTLTLAGGISASTAGNKVLAVTGSGNTTISGAISAGSGAVNLVKTGTGTLTLSGGGAIGSGFITTYGGTGSAVLLGGITKITSGTYTSAGEFIVGGVLSAGGAGVNTNFTMDGGSLNISSYLSLGRGNGVGAVSSDIVLNNSASLTASNFSAGFNNTSANLPKSTFTLNGTSSFTVGSAGQFTLAESSGSNATITLNGSSNLTVTGAGTATNRFIGGSGATGVLTLNNTSSATFGASILNIGYQNGNGTLNLNGTSTLTIGSEIRIAASNTNGTFSGSGTINVNGGTLNANALTLARNNNDVASTFAATVNVNSGTVNVTNGGTLVGWRGTASTGTINIAGGTFNQGTTAATNMDLGTFAGATGTVNVTSGSLTLQNNSNLRFSANTGNTGSNNFTISGGNVTFYGNAGTTVGGTGVVDLMNTAATATNTINLNGGTLTANQIKATSATGTRVINFNGGTLKAAGSGLASTFLASGVATTANVRNGGAIIDTNGNTVTIGQALVHSTIGGDNAIDGGLTKINSGTLTLSGANTFTGAATVNAGTLESGATGTFGAGNVNVAASAALTFGNNTSIADLATLTFASSSTINLNFTGAETLGAVYNSISSTYLADGTYTASQLNTYFGDITAFTGAGSLTVTAIPEPSTFAILAGLGVLGLVGFRRRRNT